MTEAPRPPARYGRRSLALAAAGFGTGLISVFLSTLVGHAPEWVDLLLTAQFIVLFMGLAPLLNGIGLLAGLAALWFDRRKVVGIAGIVANAASLAIGFAFFVILQRVVDMLDANTPL